MPVPGKCMTPIGSTSSIASLRLNGAALACLVQFGLEGDLRDLAVVGPFGGDQLGALRRSAVQQHHVRVLGVDLVELGPDQPVIVEVEPAGQRHLRSRGQEHLVVGALLRRQEVAAVDHRRGEVAMVDLRPVARPPGRVGVVLELVGGLVAHQLEGVAPFDQRLAFRRQALQLDGFDLAAVLFPLASAAAPARCRRVRVRSGRWRGGRRSPSTRAGPRGRVRGGCRSAPPRGRRRCRRCCPRGCALPEAAWDRARPGRDGSHRAGVRGGPGRSGMSCGAARNRRRGRWSSRLSLSDRPRPSRPSWRRRQRAERTCTRSEAEGRSLSGGRQGADYFVSRCKGGLGRRRKIVGPQAIAGPGRLLPDRPLRRPWAWSSPTLRESMTADPDGDDAGEPPLIPFRLCRQFHEAGDVLRPRSAPGSRPEARRSRAARRSSLKSPSRGEITIASIPASCARSINVAIAPSPAGSSSRAM